MAVKIRMKRFGRTNEPHYRINAMDTRSSRDGRIIEELGIYDPHGSDADKVTLNAERILYWLSVGAQPSETVRSFLKKAGLIDGFGKPVRGAAEAVTAASAATQVPPTQAPSTQVPPTQAPSTQAPPTQAPPTQA